MGQLLKVYRIEHIKSGKGPYQHSVKDADLSQIIYNNSFKDVDHPGPKDDFMNTEVYENDKSISFFIFGCLEIATLHKWFKGYISLLLKHDFQVVAYEIEAKYVFVGKSNKQVAFRRANANSRKVLLPLPD